MVRRFPDRSTGVAICGGRTALTASVLQGETTRIIIDAVRSSGSSGWPRNKYGKVGFNYRKDNPLVCFSSAFLPQPVARVPVGVGGNRRRGPQITSVALLLLFLVLGRILVGTTSWDAFAAVF